MLTVVWDVDDVLNDLMWQWLRHGWNSEHPECRLRYEELTANPPHEVLGVSREEYLASMDAFRRTDRALAMRPNPAVLAWFESHGQRFRHIALTARPLETAPDVAHWVMRHFGAWVRCFGVVPTRTPDGAPVYDRSKAEFLQWLKQGDVLIDDSMENLSQAHRLGLQTLVYKQPWNDGVLTESELLEHLSGLEQRA
jgi:hypothetical protein